MTKVQHLFPDTPITTSTILIITNESDPKLILKNVTDALHDTMKRHTVPLEMAVYAGDGFVTSDTGLLYKKVDEVIRHRGTLLLLVNPNKKSPLVYENFLKTLIGFVISKHLEKHIKAVIYLGVEFPKREKYFDTYSNLCGDVLSGDIKDAIEKTEVAFLLTSKNYEQVTTAIEKGGVHKVEFIAEEGSDDDGERGVTS